MVGVVFEGAGEGVGHHGAELGRGEHSDARTVGEEFLHEVGGNLDFVVED